MIINEAMIFKHTVLYVMIRSLCNDQVFKFTKTNWYQSQIALMLFMFSNLFIKKTIKFIKLFIM